ncbi:hypothetical protein ACJ73_03853 [Blastomyces percursus]|uniref:Uncharacterized protein n=1 Tax=Blastomyces percursus TaxID=1658174 RepID=A0A1J9R9W9_9EURO|nr:hypothetical protein ACJ73_03853 [Blastomyces percursus]
MTPYDPYFPGHSDKHEVQGSSSYGCQTRDSQIISPRNPDRSGEDDGTSWTGETVFSIKRRPTRATNGLDELDTVCNGIYRMSTVSWVGPPTQGSHGTGKKFAFGMIAWETNDTDKSNAWHPTTTMEQSHPPDDATMGLNLIGPPPRNETPNPRPSQQIFFDGIYNGIKESEEYLGKSAIYFGKRFTFTGKFKCTRSAGAGDDDFGFLPNGGGYMPPHLEPP